MLYVISDIYYISWSLQSRLCYAFCFYFGVLVTDFVSNVGVVNNKSSMTSTDQKL